MKIQYRREPLPYVCPHCGADFCNEFALFKHFNVCQLRKTEPEE